MNKKGNLFFLVRSMSGPEKRYFRLYAGASPGTNYIRLFDFIEQQTKASDDEIKKHFKGEKFARQLHVAKIYLTDLILKSLRNYYTGHSVYSDILDLLREVEILFERELYDLCRLRLAKAQQLAAVYEKEPLMLEVLSWKRKLSLISAGSAQREAEQLCVAECHSIRQLEEINYFWQQTYRVFELYRDKNYIRTLKYKHPSSLRAKTLSQHIKYSYYFMNGKAALAEKAVTDLIGFHLAHPERITDDPSPYVTAISNKISILIGQKRWKETERLIKQMREVHLQFRLKKENKFTVNLWLRIFNLELEVYRDTGRLKEAVALIGEIEIFLTGRGNAVPDRYRLMLCYQIAAVYFSKGDFSRSLYWTNQVLNHNFSETREDLQCYARLLNLVVHFELNNIVVLRYAIDSARRFFRKKKFNSPFAGHSLQLFSALSQAYPEEYPGIYRKAYDEYFGKPGDETLQGLDYIDLKSWLESKPQPVKK